VVLLKFGKKCVVMEMGMGMELFYIFNKHYISDKRETGERK
jgi:hypothetical protein